MAQPYLNSSTLVESVRRRCSLPKADGLLSDNDILQFANDELMDSIVPEMKALYEEYFVMNILVDLVPEVRRYQIPSRATANALRDICYLDTNGNVFEMVRINRDDRYDVQYYSNEPYRFYIENDSIVLSDGTTTRTGQLQMTFLITPNQLVPTDTVAKIQSINRTTGAIIVNLLPTNIIMTVPVDFVKTKSPHNIIKFDVTPTSISYITNTFVFDVDDIPADLAVGDTIAAQYETDIPNVPTEIHRLLVSRVCERVMEAIGDQQGVQIATNKAERAQELTRNLLSNRVTSAPLKVKNTHGFLYNRFRRRRSF